MKPGEEVKPGAIGALAGLNADFALAADASDRERRLALSDWIAAM